MSSFYRSVKYIPRKREHSLRGIYKQTTCAIYTNGHLYLYRPNRLLLLHPHNSNNEKKASKFLNVIQKHSTSADNEMRKGKNWCVICKIASVFILLLSFLESKRNRVCILQFKLAACPMESSEYTRRKRSIRSDSYVNDFAKQFCAECFMLFYLFANLLQLSPPPRVPLPAHFPNFRLVPGFGTIAPDCR